MSYDYWTCCKFQLFLECATGVMKRQHKLLPVCMLWKAGGVPITTDALSVPGLWKRSLCTVKWWNSKYLFLEGFHTEYLSVTALHQALLTSSSSFSVSMLLFTSELNAAMGLQWDSRSVKTGGVARLSIAGDWQRGGSAENLASLFIDVNNIGSFLYIIWKFSIYKKKKTKYSPVLLQNLFTDRLFSFAVSLNM